MSQDTRRVSRIARPDRSIPPPASDRPPLKANVFDMAGNTATTLAPLFPYFDEGSIVPCLSVFRGGEGRRYGRFQHFNTVDEVIMMFGSPSIIFVGPKLHPVGAPFEDPTDPDNTAIALITQRQLFDTPQREEYRFLCDECDRRLSVAPFDATPPRRGESSRDRAFPTIAEGSAAAARHNANDENLRCKHCGHVNERFPVEAWGWDQYTGQCRAAAIARSGLQAASAPPPVQSTEAE